MIVFKLAFRNIIRNGNKSLTIGTLIALGIALMFVGNSIFEGTDRGIRRSFVDSFTADVSVSAVSDESFSIFGNETPVIGELATVPTIVSYDSVSKIVAGSPGVAGTASVVSGLIGIQVRDIQQAVPVFGVDGASYFSCFPGVTLVKGALLSGTAPGAMITEVRAQELEKASGKPLEIGEPIQATVMTS